MTLELVHWPDRQQRAEKAQWRSVHDLLDNALQEAKSSLALDRPHAAIATPQAGLIESLRARHKFNIGVIDFWTGGGQAARVASQHIVAVTHPETLPFPQRMDLLRRCVRALRASGRLLLVGNVVGGFHPAADGRRARIPSCSLLLEQLSACSGEGLQVQDLRSVRWGDEPVHRGVVLSMSRISIPIGW